MLPYKRSERVGKLLHQLVCEILMDIKDPRIGFVTIVDVELSDDLTEAKVFYSVLGDEKARSETQKGLKRAVGFIRGQLGPKLNLRKVPALHFVFDDTYERAERVFTLLDKISSESKKDAE
jgi:ribosome-binding factor A